jgi:hypothetical protein
MLFQYDQLISVLMMSLAPLVLTGTALGIVGKYVYDYYVRYSKASDPRQVRWDWRGFRLTAVISLILSVILYGVILGRVKELNDSVLAFSVAAQNGFFWQAIVGEVGKRYAE